MQINFVLANSVATHIKAFVRLFARLTLENVKLSEDATNQHFLN